jgi:diaminopropionate ammonia-lyase
MRISLPDYGLDAVLQEPRPVAPPPAFSVAAAARVLRFHRQLPGYVPTPLAVLADLARRWGLGGIFVKDEAHRFGLKAFKALGGSYAVARLVCRELGLSLEETPYTRLVGREVRRRAGRMTFATATDGNHGRGVAWAAEQLGQEAVVYLPRGTVASRVETIRSHGATAAVTDVNYDDTVRLAARRAEERGWYLVQDTVSGGNQAVPRWIMQGYLTLCREALDQMERAAGAGPSHVFLQAGVGALAAAVAGYLAHRYPERRPRIVLMEPSNAACFLASALAGDGRPRAVTGNLATIMAGLACGEPSPMAWNLLRDFCCAYVSCDDYVAADGIRILANPVATDPFVEAGESGAVGIGLLDLLANRQPFGELREALELGPRSRILLLNTEGATDPDNYREILWYGKYPAPDFTP